MVLQTYGEMMAFRGIRLKRPVVRFADGWSADLVNKEASKSCKNCYNIEWRRGRTKGKAMNVNEKNIKRTSALEFKGSPNYDVYDIYTDRNGGNECNVIDSERVIIEQQNTINELIEQQHKSFMDKALESVQFARQVEGKAPMVIERKEQAPLIMQSFPQIVQQKKETKKPKEAEE